MRRLSRRALALMSAGVCVAVAALAGGGVALAHRSDTVASIDGHAVTRDELVFHMRRLAPTVQNELRTKYHLPEVTDWSTTVGDGSALELLASRALDEIWRDKTTLIVAQDHGLTVPIDHEDFLAELSAENKRRADAIASGQIVYGVAEFSADDYYSHRLTEVTTALKQALSAKPDAPLWVNSTDVRRAFTAHRAAWSANATTYSYSKLTVPVPDGASPDYAARLQRRVAAAGRLTDVAAKEPAALLTSGRYDSRTAGVSAHDQDLMAVIGKLTLGETSGPVMGTGQITYYELVGKTVNQSAAFAEYSERIRQTLIEERFHQYVQRRISHSDIEVDTDAVDAINAKDVQP